MLSPRYTSGGIFRKFGTDSNGISGTFCAFARVCARPWAVRTTATRTTTTLIQRFISSSCSHRPSLKPPATATGYRVVTVAGTLSLIQSTTNSMTSSLFFSSIIMWLLPLMPTSSSRTKSVLTPAWLRNFGMHGS